MCLNDKDFVKCSAIQASIRETKTSGDTRSRSKATRSASKCSLFVESNTWIDAIAFTKPVLFAGPLLYRRCKHDQDCKYSGGFCNTTNQQCECSKDYVPSSDKHHCIQSKRNNQRAKRNAASLIGDIKNQREIDICILDCIFDVYLRWLTSFLFRSSIDQLFLHGKQSVFSIFIEHHLSL